MKKVVISSALWQRQSAPTIVVPPKAVSLAAPGVPKIVSIPNGPTPVTVDATLPPEAAAKAATRKIATMVPSPSAMRSRFTALRVPGEQRYRRLSREMNISKYRGHWTLPAGAEIEVQEDNGDELLVNLKEGLTLALPKALIEAHCAPTTQH